MSAIGHKADNSVARVFVRFWTKADEPQSVFYECAQLAVVTVPV
jgi:hypothetical protein